MLEPRNALLSSATLAGILLATTPVEAAVVFRSADLSVFARTEVVLDIEAKSKDDVSTTPRMLQAEVEAGSGLLGNNFAFAQISALADIRPDGPATILSAGFRIFTTEFVLNTDTFAAEVSYVFHYRFDVTTAARFIGEWTLGFPNNVSIELVGATPFDPLPGTFGSHERLLAAGSYDLTFQAGGLTDEFHPALPGYSVLTIGGPVDFRGFDIYSFQIIDAPTPAVPEPASGVLLALGLACCGLAARRRQLC